MSEYLLCVFTKSIIRQLLGPWASVGVFVVVDDKDKIYVKLQWVGDPLLQCIIGSATPSPKWTIQFWDWDWVETNLTI